MHGAGRWDNKKEKSVINGRGAKGEGVRQESKGISDFGSFRISNCGFFANRIKRNKCNQREDGCWR